MKLPAPLALALVAAISAAAPAQAQLLGQPPIVQHPIGNHPEKRPRSSRQDLEWMWQYTPDPPAAPEGREHELIQDPHFLPFLEDNLRTPQTFWGPQQGDVRKTLAQTADDFLTIPGRVLADDNRYVTVTGFVHRLPTSRGLLFADLNEKDPLVVFAAIDWIRDSKPTSDPDAQYTLWIFPNRSLIKDGQPLIPSPLRRSLNRWASSPLAGSGIVQKLNAAILVDPDGTPHQIPVPNF